MLLADELALLEKLVSKVEHLEFETIDEEAIKTKLLPLFDDLLLKKLSDKEGNTITILSRYLAQIITQSAAHDSYALEQSLRSIISPAIAQEIAENKDKMIDALYPIMGGMISKYVTQAIKEMMEKINEKIEQGLSVERYKRKVKAKLTGVSETELLLEESGDADIHSIFIIHKETGLLIAEAHMEYSEIDDPHMVASMASAIKDFVNDWISSHQETESKEVQLLSYGDATLYIETAGSVYLIAFLDSEPDYAQRSEINSFFAKLLQKYSSFFQSFEGDDSVPEIKKIEMKLHTFLNEENTEKRESEVKNKKNPAKIIMIIVILILLGAGGYWAQKHYTYYLLEKEIAQKTGADIELKEEEGKLYLKGEIEKLDTLYAIKGILHSHTDKPIVNALYMPIEELDHKLKKQHQEIVQQSADYQRLLEKRMQETTQQAQLWQKELNQEKEKLNALFKRLSHVENQLEQRIKEEKRKKEKTEKIRTLLSLRQHLVSKLKQTFQGKSQLNKNGTLVFQNKNLFEAGHSAPNPILIGLLKKDIEMYIDTLMHDPFGKDYIKKIMVKGYTDSSGSTTLNKRLSQERADEIKKYILTLPINKQYKLERLIQAKGMASQHPVIVNGVEDKEASRRIELSFELDTKKIEKEIASLEEMQ